MTSFCYLQNSTSGKVDAMFRHQKSIFQNRQGLMVVTAPAGMHKITSYSLDMSNRFVSLSLLLDKLRLIALINQLHHGTLIRLSLTREMLIHGSYCIINKTASSDGACCQATTTFRGGKTQNRPSEVISCK